jgi:predicted acyltransferase
MADTGTVEQRGEFGERAAAAAGRMVSLDVFRGLTIAGMILVNNPGTWESIYDPLEHAAWHGWTPTDLVFPFFLFIVGVSVTLALGKRAEGSEGRAIYVKILRRTAIIFALGLVLAGFPDYDLSTLRIPGVLQRIAVCYLLASLLFLHTRWRAQAAVAAALLVGYWALMALVPVPGFGAGMIDSKEANLAAYVDRALLEGHLWQYAKVYDPEGVLSTLPALATTLAGVLTGHLLRSRRGDAEKVSAMFAAGAAGVVVGWAWHHWFPINKPLWTSSYVLFTAGLALQLLAACYWLVDIHGRRAWAKPFLIFGSNALIVYFLAELAGRVIGLPLFPRAGGSRAGLQTIIYENLFASWAAPHNASLMYAVGTVLFWLGVAALLYRKRIFIKV